MDLDMLLLSLYFGQQVKSSRELTRQLPFTISQIKSRVKSYKYRLEGGKEFTFGMDLKLLRAVEKHGVEAVKKRTWQLLESLEKEDFEVDEEGKSGGEGKVKGWKDFAGGMKSVVIDRFREQLSKFWKRGNDLPTKAEWQAWMDKYDQQTQVIKDRIDDIKKRFKREKVENIPKKCYEDIGDMDQNEVEIVMEKVGKKQLSRNARVKMEIMEAKDNHTVPVSLEALRDEESMGPPDPVIKKRDVKTSNKEENPMNSTDDVSEKLSHLINMVHSLGQKLDRIRFENDAKIEKGFYSVRREIVHLSSQLQDSHRDETSDQEHQFRQQAYYDPRMMGMPPRNYMGPPPNQMVQVRLSKGHPGHSGGTKATTPVRTERKRVKKDEDSEDESTDSSDSDTDSNPEPITVAD